MPRAMLSYDKGTISIQAVAHIPYSNLDPHRNMLRAVALYSNNFLAYLANVNLRD